MQKMRLPSTGGEELCYEAYQEERCRWYNESEGDLPGERCEVCRNKGTVAAVVKGEMVVRPCGCMVRRNARRRMERSGLGGMLKRSSFGAYRGEEGWQQEVKRKALAFAKERGKWFYIGGAVGSGKTHICTAICGSLMEQGLDTRYMLWRDEARILKAAVNDNGEYAPRMEELKAVPVLYIDDLFKTRRGGEIRDADVNLAFEIINYRYMQKESITVISSEKTIEQVMDIDEAVGSRIDHRSRGYVLGIEAREGRNWRLR